MNTVFRRLLVCVTCLLLPAFALSGESNSTSVTFSDGQGVATIRGSAGIANIMNDTIEVRDGVVYVNGMSHGRVPKTAEIKYIVNDKGRTLFVDGKARNPTKA